MERQVILYQDEDGIWIAEVPSLPGCVSDGDTREQALENVRDAIATMAEFMRSKGIPIPDDPGSAEIAQVRASA